MTKKIKLGIFDKGDILDKTSFNTIEPELFQLVSVAEKLGYKRYWLGEHHTAEIAWRSPEILIALLARSTSKIKIGVAGVLLNLTSPLRVAQNYKLLESLFSGRIDLGIARAVTDPITMLALLNGQSIDENDNSFYFNKVEELINFMRSSFPENDPYRKIIVPPLEGSSPQLWLLGSSKLGVPFAVENQLHFSFAHFFDSKNMCFDIIRDYMTKYQDKYSINPECNIAVAMCCTNTDKEASEFVRKMNFPVNSKLFYGSSSTCKDYLLELQHYTGVDEFIILNVNPSIETKKNAMELLAENFI